MTFCQKLKSTAAYTPSILRTAGTFVLSTYCGPRKSLIRLVGFFVKMWLLKAEPLFILFLPTLKRLAAPRTVFIFGMLILFEILYASA